MNCDTSKFIMKDYLYDNLKNYTPLTEVIHEKIIINQYITNGSGGTQGPTGPTGPKGASGDTGPNGSIGPAGIRGVTGPTGTTGSDGPLGATGSQGPTGPIGLTGSDGPQGATGGIGSRGETGPTGQNGSNGEIGPTGPTGADGISGETGDTGPTGSNGLDGTIGSTGATGPPGAVGEVGPIGGLNPCCNGDYIYWDGSGWTASSQGQTIFDSTQNTTSIWYPMSNPENYLPSFFIDGSENKIVVEITIGYINIEVDTDVKNPINVLVQIYPDLISGNTPSGPNTSNVLFTVDLSFSYVNTTNTLFSTIIPPGSITLAPQYYYWIRFAPDDSTSNWQAYWAEGNFGGTNVSTNYYYDEIGSMSVINNLSNDCGNFLVKICNETLTKVGIGCQAGNTGQGINSVAVGFEAGASGQGDYSIAIGFQAGVTAQADNSIILNATGIPLNSFSSGFFVAPIRKTTGC